MFSTAADTMWLVVRAGVLDAGARYTFQIAATDSIGQVGTANLTLTANRPPFGGSLAVTPRTGQALSTSFLLASGGFVDPDDTLPLTYAFFYRSSSLGVQVEIGDGDTQTANSTLPPGDGDNLTLSVLVTDQLGGPATASVDVAVSVAPADVLSTVKNSTQQVSELIASGDSMAATTLIASSAELLNQNVHSFSALSAARQIRSQLLALSWNATETLGATAESINLRAATLELIFCVPAQVLHVSVVYVVYVCVDKSSTTHVKFYVCVC